jgi:EAL and modified HD-GYP domain-containing signal transduction protein
MNEQNRASIECGADVLLARQSILDKNHSIFGFEMLYRGSNFDASDAKNNLKVTSELLTNICTCVIEEKFNANHPMFINVDERFIQSPSFFPSPTDRIILELLEAVPATPNVLSKIKELTRQGFEFALDDYIFDSERTKFLPLVSIVKIDMLACSFEDVQSKVDQLKKYPAKLLAEKIESFEMFDKCVDLGFDLFQGYYLEKPKIIKGTKVPVNKEVTLRLLSELTRPNIAINEVADLIVCDPRLAMKIILLVNSSLFSFVREVNDVQEAVIMLGIDAVKRWAMILLLVSESEQPIEIFRILLCRAKTLELYAEAMNESKPSNYFSLGLFSGIDAVLGIGMDSVVGSLPLSHELKVALTESSGNMGQVLTSLKQLEKGEQLKTLFSLKEYYWKGLRWADDLMGSIAC